MRRRTLKSRAYEHPQNGKRSNDRQKDRSLHACLSQRLGFHERCLHPGRPPETAASFTLAIPRAVCAKGKRQMNQQLKVPERPVGTFSARLPSGRIWLLLTGEGLGPAAAVTGACDLPGIGFLFRGTALLAVSPSVGARAQRVRL